MKAPIKVYLSKAQKGKGFINRGIIVKDNTKTTEVLIEGKLYQIIWT
jgi:hypothetical protein